MTERQVQHMVRLIDDLLDVSRIMRGRIELRREAIELGTMIARAIETVHPILDAQGQELIVTAPPDPIWLDADPRRAWFKSSATCSIMPPNSPSTRAEFGSRSSATAARQSCASAMRGQASPRTCCRMSSISSSRAIAPWSALARRTWHRVDGRP